MEGVLFLIISLFIIYHALSLHSFGEWALSPGLFPLILGVVLLILSVFLLRKTYGVKKAERGSVSDWKTTLLSIVLCMGYILSLPILHFNLSTIVYSFLFLLILGVRNILILTILPIGLTASIYYTFGVLLRVVLP
ncbi:MAG: tripartite tricarboxylate transporter TctB family protein [Synergistetes bacterium]|nr:tripartite tricarboxylate transporter TctB family protein [Synergistota bacterium]MDW8192165.1 tripartite tricarboxylate transporter TctB family protein [Synergistota bacterium]